MELLFKQINTLGQLTHGNIRKVFQEHLLAGVPELSLSILKLLSSGDSMGISDLEKALKTPRSTIRFHLRRLIDEGRIFSSGKARAVRYQITDAPSWNFE